MEVICSSSFLSLFFSPTSYKLNSKNLQLTAQFHFQKILPREEIFIFSAKILMLSPNNPMKRDAVSFLINLNLKINLLSCSVANRLSHLVVQRFFHYIVQTRLLQKSFQFDALTFSRRCSKSDSCPPGLCS